VRGAAALVGVSLFGAFCAVAAVVALVAWLAP
jgi:hypothetical protein